MFFFASEMNVMQSTPHFNNYCFWSSINYLNNLLILTFLLWINYIVVNIFKEKQGITFDDGFAAMSKAFISNANFKYLVGLYFANKFLENIAEDKKAYYENLCKKDIDNFIRRRFLFELKIDMLNNFQSYGKLEEIFFIISNNLKDQMRMVSSGIIPTAMNTMFCMIIIATFFKNHKHYALFFLIGILGVFTLFWFCSKYFLSSKKTSLGMYKNRISLDRKMNIYEKNQGLHNHFKKVLESTFVLTIYILLVGFSIPFLFLTLNEGNPEITGYAYLCLCVVYLWQNASQFEFIFSFFEKIKENRALSNGFTNYRKDQLKSIDQITLSHFPLRSENNTFDSIILEKGSITQFIGEVGKTTVIKQILGLAPISSKQSTVIRSEGNFYKNIYFDRIVDQVVYINPKEVLDIKISEFFNIDSQLSNQEIYELLNESRVLDHIEHKDDNLDANIINFSYWERMLVCIAKIYLKKKSVFIGEDFLDSLTPAQRRSILFILGQNFKIVIYLSNKPINEIKDTYYIIKQKA